MRFRARAEVWLEVATLDHAQATAGKMESAVFDAVRLAIVPDPGRALSHIELEAVDETARAALRGRPIGAWDQLCSL
jgi:hypothetical protein